MRISDWSSDVCSSDLLTATLSDIARGAETMAVRLSDRARGTGQDAAMVAGATVQSLAGLQELGDRGRALADTTEQIVGDGPHARRLQHPASPKNRLAGEQCSIASRRRRERRGSNH